MKGIMTIILGTLAIFVSNGKPLEILICLCGIILVVLGMYQFLTGKTEKEKKA